MFNELNCFHLQVGVLVRGSQKEEHVDKISARLCEYSFASLFNKKLSSKDSESV